MLWDLLHYLKLWVLLYYLMLCVMGPLVLSYYYLNLPPAPLLITRPDSQREDEVVSRVVVGRTR